MTRWLVLLWRRLTRQHLRATVAIPVVLGLPAPRVPGGLSLPPVICLPDLTPRRPPATAPAVLTPTPGLFYFRGAILDQLDDYMVYLKRMRRADPEAYSIYSKVGAGISPVNGPISHDDKPWREPALSSWFRDTLPSFGAIAYVSPQIEKDEDEHKRLYPRFMWFTKYERQSPTVEFTTRGASYCCTVYWDKQSRSGMTHGSPQQFPVVILPDGRVELLRVSLNQTQVIHHKHGRHRGYTSQVPHQRWGIWPEFIRWAQDHKAEPSRFLAGVFTNAANRFQAVNSSMIRVTARKNGIAATFGVDVTRTPYFFADRDETVSQTGSKQRIFHIVRPHVRANGRGVRLHFRGLRRFTWNGYDIHITVPGLEHLDLTEFDVGAYDEHWEDPAAPGIASSELAARLAQSVELAGDWKAQRRTLEGAGAAA